MTKSQINKLGDRLRASGPPDDETLSRLQEFRGEYDGPMVTAHGLIQQRLGLATTARLKTVNTMVEKLRRAKTRLAEMQDIAGIRIVRKMRLLEQDALVLQLREVFPGCRVMDRRKTPSYGYRAVHVIATVETHLVEIQVRTEFQDLWAQAMESFADRAGRGIRYGHVPEAATARVETLQQAGREIASLEEGQEQLREREAALARATPASLGSRENVQRQRAAGDLRAILSKTEHELRQLLEGILLE